MLMKLRLLGHLREEERYRQMPDISVSEVCDIENAKATALG